MRSFQAAERALDAEALLGQLAQSPEFHVYDDGELLDYDMIRAKLHSVFPTLRSIEGGFHRMHVFVLAPDTALAAGAFREAITDGGGTVVRMRGAATWL
jgi:hypothetical protein